MYNKFEKSIFIIYLLLLPITCFRPLEEYLMSLTNSVSALFHFLGLLLIFMNYKNNKIKINRTLKFFIIMILLLNISSLLMASILYSELGVWLGRNTFIAIFPQIVYYIQIAFILYYNSRCFKKFGLKLVDKITLINIFYLLILGYIQIMIINFNIAPLENIYERFVGLFVKNSYVLTHNRICLVGTEASVAGVLLSIYILPYIMSKIIIRKKIKYFILFLLYLPIIYYTKSTSAYLGLLMVSVIYIYIYIKENFTLLKIFASMLICGIIICIYLLYSNNCKNNINSEILYNIKSIGINKILDENNFSTIHRSTSVYTNMESFKHYPILGVGNGNQGFFYRRYFPIWGNKAPESIDYYTGKSGWPGAGAFIPAYISGYGLFGLILISIFIKKSKEDINRLKKYNKEWVFFYYIGMSGFLISSIISIDIVGNYYISFILSMPLVSINFLEGDRNEYILN